MSEGEGKFQADVGKWMLACFGLEISADVLERVDRFIEEALELAQTEPSFTADRAHSLVNYVFARPRGVAVQEVGGVMVTLAAFCNTGGIDINDAAATELARIWTKVDAIRAKQASKPTGSALPVARATPAAELSEDELLREAREVKLSLQIKNDWTGHFPAIIAGIRRGLELARNLPAAPGGDEWLPIETAPRDGTNVLIWSKCYGSGSAVVAWWSDDHYATRPIPRWITGLRHYSARDLVKTPPRYWRPLPAPPRSIAGPVPGAQPAIYIAARFSRRPEANKLARHLQQLGHKITSRWVKPDTDHVLPTGISAQAADAERARFAQEDCDDVRTASWTISLMEEPRSNSRGGRHVEFGMAVALSHRLTIIGPRETVFHHLPNVEHFDSIEAFLLAQPAPRSDGDAA